MLQRYKIDITALQEIRWKGNSQDEDRSASRCDMYYRCHPTNHEFGVGFAVRGKTRFCVTRWINKSGQDVYAAKGHVETERMDDNAAEKIYNVSVEGVRRRGRQRVRWVELVEKDAKELRIPSWKSTGRNRELWATYCCKLDSAEGSSVI